MRALAVLLLCAVSAAAQAPKVFIAGSNAGAVDARKKARKAKCFTMVANQRDATHTLGVTETERFRVSRGRIISSDSAAVLSTADGTQVWQSSSITGAQQIVARMDKWFCKGGR